MKNIKVPSSKSVLNRILIISTMLEDKLAIEGFSEAEDIATLKKALQSIGYTFRDRASFTAVSPPEKNVDSAAVFINNSATAFRFLLARLSAAGEGSYILDASHQLRKRPMQPLTNALISMGAQIQTRDFPWTIRAASLRGGKLTIDTSLSSQFVSALLLAAPLFTSDLELNLIGSRVSWDYVNMTINLLRKFGVEINCRDNSIQVPAPQKLINIRNYAVEPDFSAAATFWALAAAHNKKIRIEGNRLFSSQPDAAFPSLLEEMGAKVTDEGDATIVEGKSLHGVKFNMKQMPDQVPNLAAIALLADSPTQISGIDNLQYKESNRISAIISEFKKLQADVSYENGIMKISPLSKRPPAAALDSYNDHRLAMAFAILKLRYPHLRITATTCVNKSFPEFWQQYSLIEPANSI